MTKETAHYTWLLRHEAAQNQQMKRRKCALEQGLQMLNFSNVRELTLTSKQAGQMTRTLAGVVRVIGKCN